MFAFHFPVIDNSIDSYEDIHGDIYGVALIIVVDTLELMRDLGLVL